MKKSILLLVLLASIGIGTAQTPGTPDTGWYTNNPGTSSFTLTTAAQLAGLAELVNAGHAFADTTFVLGNDIDLSTLDLCKLITRLHPAGYR